VVSDIEVQQWLREARQNTQLSGEEKENIADDISSGVRVKWLPDKVHLRRRGRGLAIESVLFVALGVAAGEFLKGALGEAGKDAWNAARTIVIKTFRKQVQRSYQLSIKAYLILDWRDNQVRFLLLQDMRPQGDPLQHLEQNCDRALSDFSAHWNDIETALIKISAENASKRQAYDVVLTNDHTSVWIGHPLLEDEPEGVSEHF
jgi:hypothetical protein